MQGGGPWITWGPRLQAISHSDICDEAKLTSWALLLLGLTWQAAAGQTKPHCWSSDPAGWLDKPGSAIESLESNCYLVCSLNCRMLFYKCGPFFFWFRFVQLTVIVMQDGLTQVCVRSLTMCQAVLSAPPCSVLLTISLCWSSLTSLTWLLSLSGVLANCQIVRTTGWYRHTLLRLRT